MKKYLAMLSFALVLVGCSDKTYEPKEIHAATDICEICNMSISHEDYAGQIVFTNNDHQVFDDLGCLMEFIHENGEKEIGAAYIKDESTNTWVNIKDATYVYDQSFWTPMNYGVLAFSTQTAANDYIAGNGKGELLAFEDLDTFEWGIHSH